MIKLRPYQEEALAVMRESEVGSPKLIALPTGAGKGTLFAALANSSKGRVLIVVPSGELLKQGIEKIIEIDENADVGMIQASKNQLDTKIMVGTRQSLNHSKSTRIERMLKHGEIEYIIIDEAHLAVDQQKAILSKMKNVKVIGMTATPFNPSMNSIYDEINYQKSILSMIDEGYLCEPQALLIFSKTDLSKIRMVAGDFNQNELETAVNNVDRNRLIVKAYKEHASNRKATIVFCTGIEHCKTLLEEFKSEGFECCSIDSNMSKDERESNLNKFVSGEVKIMLNVNILSTGYDLPKIDCVILAKPTRSRIFYTQAIGRGLRNFKNKLDTLIIDITDNCRNHDLMSLSTVFNMPMKDGETPKKAIERIKQEKEAEELRRVQEEERKLAEEIKKKVEIELYFERIKLFNRDMTKRFAEAKYDWFRVDALTYAVSYELSAHYVIHNAGVNYNVYNVSTDKNYKNANLEFTTRDIMEAIAYAEKRTGKNSYTERGSVWKLQPASEKQKQYYNAAVTKQDAHKYFAASAIGTAVKKVKREMELDKIMTS